MVASKLLREQLDEVRRRLVIVRDEGVVKLATDEQGGGGAVQVDAHDGLGLPRTRPPEKGLHPVVKSRGVKAKAEWAIEPFARQRDPTGQGTGGFANVFLRVVTDT